MALLGPYLWALVGFKPALTLGWPDAEPNAYCGTGQKFWRVCANFSGYVKRNTFP